MISTLSSEYKPLIASIAARAPKQDPPIPHTNNTSTFSLNLAAVSFIN